MRMLIFFLIFNFFIFIPALEASETGFKLPINFPEVGKDDAKVEMTLTSGGKKDLTLVPNLQANLTKYLRDNGSPIASVVLVDVKTGKVLAMAQGRDPHKWGGTTHTALHVHFPAASLFKTVVTGAAFELIGTDPENYLGLNGGCQDVRPSGIWMQDEIISNRRKMNLRKAFGSSCNGFFAKLAVNYLGLNALNQFAARFGWDGRVATDFDLEKSPISPPNVKSSSVHAVGRFAAGFGYVGISAVHAAWLSLAIANNGIAKRINLFRSSLATDAGVAAGETQVVSADTAEKMRSIMDATIKGGGTSSFAFRRGKYRRLLNFVGGKTGTLSGKVPKGVVTWFTGMMPLDNPEVVVAAVVVLEDLWHIKAPNLAAEALWAYEDYKINTKLSSEKIPQVNPF